MRRRLRYAILAVFLVALAVPAAASADHPWNPPAWFTEAVSGGQEYAGSLPEFYDCKLHHEAYVDVYGGQADQYSYNCSRKYPNGYAHCNGSSMHHIQNPRSVYSISTYYQQNFKCRVGPVGRFCNRVQDEKGDSGWISEATNQPDPQCLEYVKRAPNPSDRDRDGVRNNRDKCPDKHGRGSANGCPQPKARCTGGFYESNASFVGRRGKLLSYGADVFWCWNPATKQVEVRQVRPVGNADLGGTTDQWSLSNIELTLREAFVFSFAWADAKARITTESRPGGRKLVTVSSGTFKLCNEIDVPVSALSRLFKLKLEGRRLPGRLGQKVTDLSRPQRQALASLLRRAFFGRIDGFYRNARKAYAKKLRARWAKGPIDTAELAELVKAGAIGKSRAGIVRKRYGNRIPKKWSGGIAGRWKHSHRVGEEKRLRQLIDVELDHLVNAALPKLCLPVWQPTLTFQIGRGGIEFKTQDGTSFEIAGKRLLDITDPS